SSPFEAHASAGGSIPRGAPAVAAKRPHAGSVRMTTRPARLLATALFTLSCSFVAPRAVWAGPAGGSASGQVGTRGASGSSSGSGYDWPEMVVGGNALSFVAPLQIGMVGYLPKARFGFQYDRQLRKAHWIYGGVA